PDVHLDRQKLRLGDVGSEFASDRPPRLASTDDAKLLLEPERIDLHHAAVDREVQLGPDLVLESVRPRLDLLQRATLLTMRRNRNAPLDEGIEQFRLRLERQLLT